MDIPRSGPELDLIIGTEVLGWTVGNLYKDEPELNINTPMFYDADGSLGLFTVGEWRPSRCDDCAWRLVYALQEKIPGFVIILKNTFNPDSAPEGPWCCEMFSMKATTFYVYGKTPAEAISRASVILIRKNSNAS